MTRLVQDFRELLMEKQSNNEKELTLDEQIKLIRIVARPDKKISQSSWDWEWKVKEVRKWLDDYRGGAARVGYCPSCKKNYVLENLDASVRQCVNPACNYILTPEYDDWMDKDKKEPLKVESIPNQVGDVQSHGEYKVMGNATVHQINNHLEYLGYKIENSNPGPNYIYGFVAKANGKPELHLRANDDIVHIFWGTMLPKNIGLDSVELLKFIFKANRSSKFGRWYIKEADNESGIFNETTFWTYEKRGFGIIIEYFIRDTENNIRDIVSIFGDIHKT